jgi:ribosome-associated translation inhibitor RaiA
MLTKNSLVTSTKEHLHNVFPQSDKIKVEVYIDNDKQYSSSIQIQTNNGDHVFTHNKDFNLKVCLDKAVNAAIEHQIQRLKNYRDKLQQRSEDAELYA